VVSQTGSKLDKRPLAKISGSKSFQGSSGKDVIRVAGYGEYVSVGPVPSPVTRIISDLHYGDPSSWLQKLPALKPLLENVEGVVVNGDAMDTQVLDEPASVVAELKDFFASAVPKATFLTGNHDPDISSEYELSLAEGAVWLTHGDVLYDNIAPWGHLAGEISTRVRRLSAGISPTDFSRIETRMPILRKACLKLPRELDPSKKGAVARVLRIARAVFPPHRVLIMMKTWREFPHRAAALARAQRPRAKVIVMGHTHSSGVWHLPDGRTVINTGCFCALKGGQVVDVFEDRVVVRELIRRAGEFHAGNPVASVALPARRLQASPNTSSSLHE
jgi:predicted phosphodiesterase